MTKVSNLWKFFTGDDNEGDQMATDNLDNTVGRQQVQEDQRPVSHKQKRKDRQDEQVAVTSGAESAKAEDKRGNRDGDSERGHRERQLPTQDTAEGRQKNSSDTQEQRDGRIQKMKREIDRQQLEITSMKREWAKLWQEAETRREKLVQSEQESGKLHREIQGLRESLAQFQSNRHALEQKLQRQEQDTKILQTESHELQAQHARTLTLLETRTLELKGAQAFLTKSDSLSGAEVTLMVEGLNSEILQTAAFVADSFEFSGTQTYWGSEQNEAYKRVEHMLGQKMAMILTSVRHSEDPMMIQIALQSCLVYCSAMIGRAWCFEKSHEILERVYANIRQAGELHNI